MAPPQFVPTSSQSTADACFTFGWITLLAVLGACSPTKSAEEELEVLVEFERDVLPLLEASCFECHGPHATRIRGGLRMDGLDSLLIGGHHGPAIVPGNSDESFLIRLVRHEVDSIEMPPKAPLTAVQIDLLERWIDQGPDWPAGVATSVELAEIDVDAGREWWSFRPVERPEPPQVSEPDLAARVRNDVDRFIFSRWIENEVPAAPEAEERILLRRLYIDLTGMPPSFEDVQRYLADEREDKWSMEVDALLASPSYGERQARHWLDVVRFAQTNGYERDAEKPHLWRYRDYVIDAFNADKAFDAFLREQIAGDELEPRTDEALVATGFYHLGTWDSEPNDREQALFDGYDDVLRTISEGMLGVTVGCARCHDHRTDPFRREDYFSLLAFLRGVEPYRAPEFHTESRTHRLLGDSPERRLDWESKRAGRESELIRERDELYAHYGVERVSFDDAEGSLGLAPSVRQSLSLAARHELFLAEVACDKIQTSFEGDYEWAPSVFEVGAEAPPTFVHNRGRASHPLQEVEPELPPVLCASDRERVPEIAAVGEESTGRRLALANWITDPRHPTTARVFVNRVWQGHFGRGLVATPNDFGATGSAPSHPQLLDWLAAEFVDGGWSVKALHRTILQSTTYRLASDFASDAAQLVDPENELLWRHPLRRLDAESLHDSVLCVARSLDTTRGGRGYFPSLGREVLAGSSRPGLGWGYSTEEERNRRAIYAFIKRGRLDPFASVFDFPDPGRPQGTRASTNVASQALTLLNGEFHNRHALTLARQLLEECGSSPANLVTRLYQRVLLREPDANEMEIALAFLNREESAFAKLPQRLTFRPALPHRVDAGFLARLPDDALLHGPRRGWEPHRGMWTNGYNGTLEAEAHHGPALLSSASEVADCRIQFDMEMELGCERAAFLLRSNLADGDLIGLQVEFDTTNQQVSVLHLGGAGHTKVLATASGEFEPQTRIPIGIELFATELRVWRDRECLIDIDTASYPERPGRFGVRVAGGAVHVSDVRLASQGQAIAIDSDYDDGPETKALALLCLTVLNLNEFLYVQ